MIGGGEDNSLYYCPDDGKVYHKDGNDFNQLEPEWKEKDRINSKANLASHILCCDSEIAPTFIEDYLQSIEATAQQKKQLRQYAKAGCLIKMQEGK